MFSSSGQAPMGGSTSTMTLRTNLVARSYRRRPGRFLCGMLHIQGAAFMERKQASDYPQELLDLFHEYQHGDITRRDFLERAKKFAVGGVTAMVLFEGLT